MKKKSSHISTVIILTTVIFLIAEALAETESTTKQNNEIVTPAQFRPSPLDRRPSFWTKTANNLRQSTLLRMHRPYNRTFLQRRYSQVDDNTIKPISEPTIEQPRRRRIKVRYNPEQNTEESSTEGTSTEKSKEDDLETKIMKDESFIGLKDFAAQLINETTAYFTKKQSQGRSYPVPEEPPQHQLWDDKDQTYHASTFATAEYEPSAYHHHFIPPPTVHYLPPQKKDDYLFTKFAMIALLKLILAKLKAIGFMKLMLLFFLKIPILFFKFLFILKGFKLLKLVSIPFIMASFAAPFLPLLPFFIPFLFFPMLLFPFFLPLLLPLLFFLPIVPVTTPGTAAAQTNVGRRKRSLVSDDFNLISNRTWTVMDEKWKNQQNNTNSRARYFRTRVRPATFEHRRHDYRTEYDYYNKYNQYEQPEPSENLIELTQKVVESQHCLERVACELASHNESKIYQAAIIWALRKVHNYAPDGIKRKIEKYSHAYETGAHRRSSDYCQERFQCQRPRIILIQGKSSYNVF